MSYLKFLKVARTVVPIIPIFNELPGTCRHRSSRMRVIRAGVVSDVASLPELITSDSGIW